MHFAEKVQVAAFEKLGIPRSQSGEVGEFGFEHVDVGFDDFGFAIDFNGGAYSAAVVVLAFEAVESGDVLFFY